MYFRRVRLLCEVVLLLRPRSSFVFCFVSFLFFSFSFALFCLLVRVWRWRRRRSTTTTTTTTTSSAAAGFARRVRLIKAARYKKKRRRASFSCYRVLLAFTCFFLNFSFILYQVEQGFRWISWFYWVLPSFFSWFY